MLETAISALVCHESIFYNVAAAAGRFVYYIGGYTVITRARWLVLRDDN